MQNYFMFSDFFRQAVGVFGALSLFIFIGAWVKQGSTRNLIFINYLLLAIVTMGTFFSQDGFRLFYGLFTIALLSVPIILGRASRYQKQIIEESSETISEALPEGPIPRGDKTFKTVSPEHVVSNIPINQGGEQSLGANQHEAELQTH